ncbi:MAG: glutamate 5-kinase [Myxococcales bacterium]|nr:glutamate 5-kinase [Myxococcales bacterium]
MTEPNLRASLAEARRVVVKVGSRSLVAPGRFERLAAEIAALRADGRSVVLVSSGAIALGRARLGLDARPKDIPRLQAAAAAGQSRLVRAWEDAFEPHGLPAAQVLLTHADLGDRDRYLNARRALDALLELGAVPIINENDTVAVDEIKFGDNDQLAAMVATLVGADLLVLMTDVDGVLDAEGVRVPVVYDVDEVARFLRAPTDDVGLGGMASKVEAARRATLRGVPVLIASVERPDGADTLTRIVAGDDVGTLFLPQGARLPSRKHWIAYTLRPRGEILVDAGAEAALKSGKASLLPAGVIGVRGDFEPGDAVRVLTVAGTELARGLARYATLDVARLAGAKREHVEARLGRPGSGVIVHRDDLVLT